MRYTESYALSFLGTPYHYSGNNPIGGIDCSGLVCEILRSTGVIGREDLSAQDLFNKFDGLGATYGIRKLGALAFYGKSVTAITHVAWVLSPYQIIEAGGGDSTTDTLEEAKARNAFVRLRTIEHRPDLVATLMPRYAPIGFF